jgi:hypothetical protein
MICLTDADQLQREASRIGRTHFFDRASMRFFDSRILSPVYGCRFFVTSERFRGSRPELDGARRYTVREFRADGSVETIGDFQQFASAGAAKRHAEKLAHEDPWPRCSACSARIHPDLLPADSVCLDCRQRERWSARQALRRQHVERAF